MAIHKHLVAGGQTLVEQERALNETELLTHAKVTAYAESPGTPNNEAVLDDVPMGQQLGPLHLEAADDDTQAAKVIAEQKKAGKTLAFQGKVFVVNIGAIVLGFR